MNQETQTEKNNVESPLRFLPKITPVPLQTAILKTGFKPAKTYTHAILRLIMVFLLIVVIYYTIKTDKQEQCDSIDDINHIIKPGSAAYNALNEIEEPYRSVLVKRIECAASPDPPISKKFMNGIRVALIAGMATEYIINGNESKPIGIMAKTVVYNLIYIISTM